MTPATSPEPRQPKAGICGADGPASAIRAVVFDWGGVIQRTADPAPRAALDQALGLAPGGVERAVFDSAAWAAASAGRLSAEAAWRTILRGLGLPHEALADFVQRFFAGDRLDLDLIAWVRRLRAQGCPVALLSNAPPPLDTSSLGVPDRVDADQLGLATWGMPGLFDVQVFSYEVGALKPDPAMYAAIMAKLKVPAPATLFIDDAPANIAGAISMGMQAILFRGPEALAAELGRIGLSRPGEQVKGC